MKTKNYFTLFSTISLILILFIQCQQSEEVLLTGQAVNSNELNQSLTQRGMHQEFTDFKFLVNNCIETIVLTGTQHFIFSDFKIINENRFMVHSHFNLKGIGIGLKSGNRYEWIATGGKMFSGNFINGQSHVTSISSRKLVGHGDVPTEDIDFHYTLRINANGEIVVENIKASSTCD